MKKILAVLLAVALVVTLSFSAVMMVSATGAQFVVSTKTAKAGDTKVPVTISLEGNTTGIASIKLTVSYPDQLTLKNVKFDSKFTDAYTYYDEDAEENVSAPAPEYTGSKANPSVINWVSKTHNVTGDGVFVTLTFDVSDDATVGDKDIEVAYDDEDIFYYASGSYEDSSLGGTETNVAYSSVNGKITVVSCLHDGAKTNHPAVASTCKTAGHEAYTTCDLCGAVVEGSDADLPLDPSNHEGDTEIVNAAPATCTAAGYTGDKVCKACGATLEGGTTIPVTSHTLGEWLTNPEEHWKVCSECEGKFELGYHDYDSVVTPASCTEGGYTTYTCKVCGYSVTGNETDPLNHTGGTANCHSGAICTRCGEAYGDKDPSNHDGGTELKNAKVATTEEEGYTGDTVCKGCGVTLEKGEIIDKLIAYDAEVSEEKYDATSSSAKAIGVTAKFGNGKTAKAVKVNGTVISEDKYDVAEDEEGNTVVTLKEDYLKSLGNGNYSVTVVTDDGIAETSFEVVNSQVSSGETEVTVDGKGNSPKTGDMDIAIIVIALLGVMAASMFAGFTYRRKNED